MPWFSMAAIVYFVLKGEPPYQADDSRALLAMQLAGRVTLDDFAPPVAAWLRRGLEADPDQRFTDAAEMQEAWREAVREVLADHDGIQGWLRSRVERFFERSRSKR